LHLAQTFKKSPLVRQFKQNLFISSSSSSLSEEEAEEAEEERGDVGFMIRILFLLQRLV